MIHTLSSNYANALNLELCSTAEHSLLSAHHGSESGHAWCFPCIHTDVGGTCTYIALQCVFIFFIEVRSSRIMLLWSTFTIPSHYHGLVTRNNHTLSFIHRMSRFSNYTKIIVNAHFPQKLYLTQKHYKKHTIERSLLVGEASSFIVYTMEYKKYTCYWSAKSRMNTTIPGIFDTNINSK